ncbi:hypothetical protein ABPG72_014626, partial [Tetrahymena utriculariae]
MMQNTLPSSQRGFQSINPTTNKLIQTFEFDTKDEISNKISKSFEAYKTFKELLVQVRTAKFLKLVEILENHTEVMARSITEEMGKPITLSRAEVQKVIFHIKYYCQNAEHFNRQIPVKIEADNSYTSYEPLGIIYTIIPFNFPFWIAFKGTTPYMTIGNAVIVRGSDSTPRTTILIKKFMKMAGFGDEFQIVNSKQEGFKFIVSNPKIRGVSFTGSSAAGQIIASISEKHLKKCVMELGGSDPFIVLEDSDIAINGRLKNAGQVCNSSKRLLIHHKLYEQFKEQLIERLKSISIGDTLSEQTELGPLARKDILVNLQRQIQQALEEKSAILLYGNKIPENLDQKFKQGNFIIPIVMEVTDLNSIIMREENFGLLFALYKIKNVEEAISIANSTEYGLGSVVISKDTEQAEQISKRIECGISMINQACFSDTRCSAGGVKRSGYGKECGEWGVMNLLIPKLTGLINKKNDIIYKNRLY